MHNTLPTISSEGGSCETFQPSAPTPLSQGVNTLPPFAPSLDAPAPRTHANPDTDGDAMNFDDDSVHPEGEPDFEQGSGSVTRRILLVGYAADKTGGDIALDRLVPAASPKKEPLARPSPAGLGQGYSTHALSAGAGMSDSVSVVSHASDGGGAALANAYLHMSNFLKAQVGRGLCNPHIAPLYSAHI